MEETDLAPGRIDVPVEGPGDTEALALQRSLTPRLTEDAERELAFGIHTDYHASLMDRSEWERRLVEWENAYYNKVEEKEFPWPGAANFHVPFTMTGVETYKPRLVEGVLGQSPPIQAVATTGAGERRKDIVETFMNWQILNEIPEIDSLVAQSAHLFLQPGLAIAKTYWKVERKRRRYIREFPGDTPIEAIFEALFGTTPPSELEKVDNLTWEGEIPTTLNAGGPLQVKLEMAFLDESGAPTIQVKVEREEVLERPDIVLIDPTDLIVPVKGGGNPNDQPYVIHRQWWDENRLRSEVKKGRLYKDAIEELLAAGPPRGDQPTMDSGAYRQSVDATEGVEGQGPSNVRREQWEILETYLRYDIDGDGFEEEIIVWTCPYFRGNVLGWDYLDNAFAHGRRPFRVGRFFPIPFRWYGLSFAEVVKGIQDELNAIHNQRVDYGTIQNLPWFVYRASSTTPGIKLRLIPGEGLPVDNVQDILFPKFQGDQAWGQQEEALLMQHGERLTGLTDLSIGRQPNRVGATRTASGTQTLLSEAGLRFKGVMRAFQEFWVGIFQDILALNQEYLPPNKEIRVTGKQPAVMLIKDRTEIRGSYDLRIAATTDTLNRQKSREDATAIMQMVLNPTLMQGGIIGLKGVRRATEDFFKAFGKDPVFYVEDQAPIHDPTEELAMFVLGEYVSPVQGENIQRHLQMHEIQLQDVSITPEAKALINQHIQETYMLARQLMMMQQASQSGGQPPQGAQAANGATGAAEPQAPATGPQPPAAGMTPAMGAPGA